MNNEVTIHMLKNGVRIVTDLTGVNKPKFRGYKVATIYKRIVSNFNKVDNICLWWHIYYSLLHFLSNYSLWSYKNINCNYCNYGDYSILKLQKHNLNLGE